MKHLSKLQIPLILAVMLWLVGGFIAYDWNPANWAMEARIGLVCVWFLLSDLAAFRNNDI